MGTFENCAACPSETTTQPLRFQVQGTRFNPKPTPTQKTETPKDMAEVSSTAVDKLASETVSATTVVSARAPKTPVTYVKTADLDSLAKNTTNVAKVMKSLANQKVSKIDKNRAMAWLEDADFKNGCDTGNQRSSGDCYLLAGMRAVKDKSSTLVNQIDAQVNFAANGTATVTFAGATGAKKDVKTVTVKAEDLEAWQAANRLAASADAGVNLTEIAYGKKRKVDKTAPNNKTEMTAVDGGNTYRFLNQLTGKTAYAMTINSGNIDSVLSTISASNRIGGMATKQGATDGIVGGHEYTFVGYNSSTGKVSLRNPWESNTVREYDKSVIARNFIFADGIVA